MLLDVLYAVRAYKVKGRVQLYGKPIAELWSVTCHMGSHSVTCYLTQVDAPRLNPSQTIQYSISLSTPEEWKADIPEVWYSRQTLG